MATDPDCLLRKMHFYSFGGLGKTAKWARAVEEGRFEMNSEAPGDGFRLVE